MKLEFPNELKWYEDNIQVGVHDGTYGAYGARSQHLFFNKWGPKVKHVSPELKALILGALDMLAACKRVVQDSVDYPFHEAERNAKVAIKACREAIAKVDPHWEVGDGSGDGKDDRPDDQGSNAGDDS